MILMMMFELLALEIFLDHHDFVHKNEVIMNLSEIMFISFLVLFLHKRCQVSFSHQCDVRG